MMEIRQERALWMKQRSAIEHETGCMMLYVHAMAKNNKPELLLMWHHVRPHAKLLLQITEL
jgi:hypothetical protein